MASAVAEISSSISVTDSNTPTVSAPTITGSSSIPIIAGSSALDMPLVSPLPHHAQQPLCLSRPRYRQGRRLTAIKAYTISDESVYLLITGVPGLKLQRELKNLCHKFGTVRCLNRVEDYPVEPFAEAYLVKYGTVKEARFAKKMLDGKNFFGGVFHVCYAPEMESVDETREKLEERRRAVQFALHKQDREKLQLEEGVDGGGSVLCQYHPDDKLASAIKRVTNRLYYKKEPVNIGPKGSHLNHKNGLDADHQFEISFHNKPANCALSQLSDDCLSNCSMAHTMAGNLKTTDAPRNLFKTVPHLQNSFSYAVPPPFHSSPGTASTNSESSQRPYVSETFSHQTNNHSNYLIANPSNNSYNVERLNPEVDNNPTQPSQETSSATASIGQQYASMSTDYEPGLGRTSGECYIAPNKKHNRNGFIHKATFKSFAIKPTKAYKKRIVKATCNEKRATDAVSKPKLGYRQVVRSLQQQRSGQGDGQLSRLQLALHATLGAPTAQNKVVPAPNRPTPKMKLLTQGVKLV